jgi:tetratricopeptide (TPR) repeat protein
MKNLITSILSVAIVPIYAQTVDSAQVYYAKGIEQKDAQLYSQAIKSLEKSLTFNPQFVEAHLQTGYVNMAMYKNSQAIANFSKARELDPQNATAIKELTELYYNYRQYPKAIELAQQCKTCSNAEKIIALSYYQQEDYAKAEKALLAVFAKDNTNADVAYALGRTYMELENRKGMFDYYEKAIALDPTKASWMNELGVICYGAGAYRKAVEYLNKAAAAGFQQSNDFNENLGFACLYSGEFDKGEKLILGILERKPGNKDLLYDLADAFYGGKQYDKSLEYLQKLLEADMKDAKALYKAGQCFIKKGQSGKGQGMCDAAIQLDPSLSRLKKQQGFGGAGL